MKQMANVQLSNASVEFPIFNSTGRSLTSSLLKVATGGLLDADANGRVTVKALRNLNFKLEPGDRVGIVGHNGAGKSTLLRALSGVYYPTTGSIQIEGQVGSLIDISLGINTEATGSENVFIRGALLGLSRAQIKSQYEQIIDFADLGDFINMPVRTYSSGMHLRLAFAVSTIVKPEILIMDEWLSVGDGEFQSRAESRLREMISETKILVIATHSRDLVESVCNRLIWLEHGAVKMDGPSSIVAKEYFS